MAAREPIGENGPITIKKYTNRRLYDTATSSYVTLDHLRQMVRDGIDFAVYDAKTSDDITRMVLTQIIVEEEAKGQNLLPIKFLRQLIGFYADPMQWIVPQYLDQVMEAFAANQERMHQSMQETFDGMLPFGNLEEMSKQNMELFENAMKMLSPFQMEHDKEGKEHTGENARTQSADEASLEKLKVRIDLLQKKLDAIAKET